jgi:enoyl-CoA hydratase/carnithine racemase
MNSSPQALVEGPPTLTLDAAVATIRLRRPSQRNSLHDVDLHTLLDFFEQLDADASVRVVVLAAATEGQHRPVFSAGYNVAGFDSGAHDPQLFEKVPEALERLRPVTIGAFRGSVYGGATDIALACDLRVALAGTEWRMPANALGLHYYPSGLRRFITRLGLNLAKRAFLTAQPIPVEDLQAASLFERLADADHFDAALDSLVRSVSALAPLSLQATKQSLNEIAAGQFELPRLREREAAAARSADFTEGRSAFAQRRAPRFSGR